VLELVFFIYTQLLNNVPKINIDYTTTVACGFFKKKEKVKKKERFINKYEQTKYKIIKNKKK
jgi:hypothetical protein